MVHMSDPVLVGPANLATVGSEDVKDLIAGFRAAGYDSRLAHDDAIGAGPEIVETVVVWVAEHAGGAAINVAITLGIEWMVKRFRSTPHKKSVYVYSYEGDSGQLTRIIEMSSLGEEPDIREPHRFEQYTRNKPPEKA